MPAQRSFVPARVTDVDGPECGCLAPAGPVRAVARPGLAPVAGDWAVVSGTELVTVLPRQTVVRRGCGPDDVSGEVLAANADLVLIVQAFSPELTPSRTEKLLALATAGSARPVLVLSQIDRAPDGAAARSVLADLAVLAESCPGTPVLGLSTAPGYLGLQRLRTLVADSVTAVFGAPGCGKTSLVAALTGTVPAAAGGARLVPLPGGGALIDTPGCDPDAPDWLAERYLSRLRAAQRARWRAASVSRRRLRPLAGGA
ncbi:GTPase RsgA [Cryptosporangium arvum]|uniref:GTPase RsgA n=1 Tax=Cryptosporangium arvum TaxID=80871 RepID=UPI0004AE861F|nr:GTPase RsgA [Cryptosporangium arvum]